MKCISLSLTEACGFYKSICTGRRWGAETVFKIDARLVYNGTTSKRKDTETKKEGLKMKNLNMFSTRAYSNTGRVFVLFLVMSLLMLGFGTGDAHATTKGQLTIEDATGPVTDKPCIPAPAAFLGDGFSPSETGYNKFVEGNIISFTSKARDVDRFREYRDLISAAYPFDEITMTVNDYGGTGLIGEYTFYSYTGSEKLGTINATTFDGYYGNYRSPLLVGIHIDSEKGEASLFVYSDVAIKYSNDNFVFSGLVSSNNASDPHQCKECGGSGKFVCDFCEGNGYVGVLSNGHWVNRPCQKCNGSGSMICPICGGDGRA